MNLKQLAEAIQQRAYFDARAAGHADPDAEMPTRKWCERIARKHAKAAKAEGGGKSRDTLAKLHEKVKADPDQKGKKKPKKKPKVRP